MSNERRVILFMLATFVSVMAINLVMDRLGLIRNEPAPEPMPPAAVAKADPALNPASPARGASDPAKPSDPAATVKPETTATPTVKPTAIALAKPSELILGSTRSRAADAYRLEVQLDQRGAGVVSVATAGYDAEYDSNKPLKTPLEILQRDNFAPLSMTMIVRSEGDGLPTRADSDTDEETPAPTVTEYPLDSEVWEVVRDAEGRAVRSTEKGQVAVFRTTIAELGLTVTKTFRLNRGEETFDVALEFSSPEKTGSIVYRLLGPHGIPIEGEWYTGTFRDAVFGQVDGSATKVATLAAYEIVKAKGRQERFSKLPLKYAGVENQYFTAIVLPWPAPVDDTKRWDAEARPVLIHESETDRQKSDIGVEVISRPLTVGPNIAATHTYKVFTGPKTSEALASFGAEDLATYRKSNWIPFASFFSRAIITPLLAMTYGLTRWVAGLFGGQRGNYGIAIILLTVIVRLGMFPLSRKQAIAAKKMQDLQPYMKEVQEKYKEDKEAQTRETFALYRKHGVNPVGGCLPALIQLPIFVGLWQALNNSVGLRHASFLYIENLAAPDMLFRLPEWLHFSFLGPYFNLLPFGVVALMLVQTKLFSPPATTPEAEMQQNMMKYMMIFMAFMFYKVPSGLGIYFITSSLWSICERLLLPKTVSSGIAKGDEGKGNDGGDGGKGGGPDVPTKPPGRFAQFWEKVIDEASKDATYRKLTEEKEKTRGRDEGRDRDGREREKTKPRARPGRRR